MPHKGGKKPAKGPKEYGAKKTTGTTKPAEKKTTSTAETKPEGASTSGAASGSSAAASAGSSKVQSSQDRTMKAAGTKAQTTAKTEPPKSTQTTEPKSTTTSTSAAAKPSTGKGPTKPDAKADPGKQPAAITPKVTNTSSSSTAKLSKEKGPAKQDAKAESKVSSGAGKATTIGAAAVGAAASVSASSKPKDEVKAEKKVSVDKIAAASTISSEKDEALDLLIDTLGGPETVPESPKFTGPEISDTPATSEYIEELGKREDTIPPKYRHLLDGKGEKPTVPPLASQESLGEEDLIAAMSSEFVSAPPEEKKPKLEEKKTAQSTASTAPAAQPSSVALTDEALDELLGTLEPPPANAPGSPEFTGPEVTEETVTSLYLEELGKRESTIPPKYRHLLDGKDAQGQPAAPPAHKPEPAMSDSELVDMLSMGFEPASPAPASAAKQQDTTKDKQVKPDVVVPSSASCVNTAAAASAGMDDALDALMGTLEGPEFRVPESPVYTGPEVTETATSAYIEELGKREGSIPPKYRHLLDGKEGEKPAPPSPGEKAMTDSELLDAFDKDFACPKSPPAAQQPPTVKPTEVDVKKKDSEAVVKSSSTSSKVQAAPSFSKAPPCKTDPIDALAGTLGGREEDPKDKKPVKDKVKEKTDKGKKEKLGEDEETIPPDYRLKEVKDKDGKPILPKLEEQPKPMSEDDLLDALTAGFVTSPSPAQCAPPQSLEKASIKSGSEEIVSSKASSVQSSAPAPPDSSAHISDDALDLLSSSLGSRQEDPDENKPVVDVVKERAKEKHIERLGDRDDTIPPEYRHLLDGKDQGKPAKPEVVKPKEPVSDDAAIDALSSGFASCDAGSSDKAKSSLKDKTEKRTAVSQAAGTTPGGAKSTSQSTSTNPSAPKTCKS
ncbi:calpastatin [Gastrophryne carolinensis]